jgi:branched-chain amino acid transport system substrate-binding protein
MIKKKFSIMLVCFLSMICLTFGFVINIKAETFKVGLVVPLSGAGAPWGRAMADGVGLAVDEVNKAGGLKVGGKTYQVEMLEYDDKYTGAGGVQAVNRLISVDKVNVIFGSISSASVLAFTPITEKAKVLVMGNSYTRKAVHPGNEYFFRVIQTSTESAKLLIPYVLKKNSNIKKVALLGPNDESGQDLSACDITEYKKKKVEIVYNEFYERSQTDFNSQLTKMLSEKPDLIDTSASSPGTTGLIVKQARDLGYKGLFLTSSGFFTKSVVDVAGKAAEGFYFAMHIDLTSKLPSIKDFLSKFKAKYNRECEQWSSPLFYDGAKVVFSLMQKNNTTDSTKIKKALEKMGPWESFGRKMHYGGHEVYGIDHQIMGPMYIANVKDGKDNILEMVNPE